MLSRVSAKFWAGKTVLVTGGHGFLGHHLLPKLKKTGARIVAPQRESADLTLWPAVKRLFKESRPDIVIHLAVHGGGIGYMKTHQGSIFYDNILMDTHVVEASRIAQVKKFVGIGTVCSYPKFAKAPFREDDLWKGYPEETNAPYGLAKKMMLVQTQAYRSQYGLNGIHLLMTNMYGPYDHFSLASSHVIPALIMKFTEAKKKKNPEVIAWGTGNVSREFLYAGDAADAILLATEKYDGSEPVNVGTGCEISIRDLAVLIARLLQYRGSIVWDVTKPDGQPKRCLDVSRAKQAFGFRASTTLEKGLKATLTWHYQQQ
jgi:GDP-L-fucose synthase